MLLLIKWYFIALKPYGYIILQHLLEIGAVALLSFFRLLVINLFTLSFTLLFTFFYRNFLNSLNSLLNSKADLLARVPAALFPFSDGIKSSPSNIRFHIQNLYESSGQPLQF